VTQELAICEVAMRSEPSDRRKVLWTIDLTSEALECLARGHSQGHIVEGWREELVQLSSISEIMTWESQDNSYQDS
jgi:hypothetical protein